MTDFQETILCFQLSSQRLQFRWSSSSGNKVQSCKKYFRLHEKCIPYQNFSTPGEVSGEEKAIFTSCCLKRFCI